MHGRSTMASASSARFSGGRAATVLAYSMLLLVIGRAPARAQDSGSAPAPASAFSDTTRPVMFLKETVVTGARYPRAYYESPQALSFVNRLQLRELAPTATGDVLAMMPGVANTKDSPWEQRPV